MSPIMEIAGRHQLKVVEDAAQAIGAEYKGRSAGSIGDVGCFSFYPTKNLGAYGDGGMITTDDDDVAKLCRSLRVHGENPKYYYQTVGYNSRLDTLQAAILLTKLPHLRKWSEKRATHARLYDEAFADIPDLRAPVVKEYSTFHIYNQYTIASPKRDKIIAALEAAEIGHCIYYPLPFHRQQCFASLGYEPGAFPASNRAAEEVVSIPISPDMTSAEQQEVISTIRGALS
jgi:dTDP-4-amino-4,6-dideoxygalactose transaminase